MNNFWGVCNNLLGALHDGDKARANEMLALAYSCLQDNVAPEAAERRQAILRHYTSLISMRSGHQDDMKRVLEGPDNTAPHLSLVTSVFNRFWQLKETLPHNLEAVRQHCNVDLVLVDFGGSDTDDIVKFIDKEFSFEILTGHLKYFRATVPWKKFHMATAKNVAHRLATGEYLMSLDADNFITKLDIDLLLEHFQNFPNSLFHQTLGPAPLSHRQWERYKLFPSAADYHDKEVNWDGSAGRIGLSKKRFEAVNGYNENFVGMGMDDIDFIIRSIRAGSDYKHYQIIRPASSVFVENGSAAKDHQHDNNVSNWERMDAALSIGVLMPFYVTDSPVERFAAYVPKCVIASEKARVTLFSSVFRAARHIKKFGTDLCVILNGCSTAEAWLLDVIGSHTPEISEALKKLAENDRIHYIQVRKDPGLYELWNTALRNIRSIYTGNLNIDDLRGRDWLPKCLASLEANLADVASPVTVPFDDPNVASYSNALITLQQTGAIEQRWFESRVVLRGDSLMSIPEHIRLTDGMYNHHDLFQVLPDGELASYCIPNASPIWRRVLHDYVGYFDENKFGCFADLALWIAASASGLRFRQIDYPALFFVSPEQAHRQQVRDDRRLWSLAVRYGNEQLQKWAARRCFDLSSIGGTYGDHHFLGWNWVRDQVAKYFVAKPGNLLLDLFVERTFFWNPNKDEKDFYYTRDWFGFVHTTPHQSRVYQQKAQNLLSLLEDPGFQRSLPHCKGLAVLSESNQAFLVERLARLGLNIPVFRLFHPNIPVDLSLADAVDSEERDRLSGMIFHVGWHLRSFSSFARLRAERKRKVLLVPKNISRDYFLKEVVNKDLALEGLKPIEEYVEHIYSASQEEYQRILRWGVVFNHYLEPAGSNMISECISSGSTLMINRHPAFEDYLGSSYPLFFDNADEAERLLSRLVDPAFRQEVRQYMKQREHLFSVGRFCRELEYIGRHIYAEC